MFKTRKKLKKAVTAAAISGLAISGAVANGVATAEPAQADGPRPVPVVATVQVYYSPNCQNASRIYGTQSTLTEAWINDTFEIGRGLPGYGQKIRNNAASIRLSPWASVTIRSVNPVKNVYYNTLYDSKYRCYNLESYGQRNKNIQFTLKTYR